jgi:nucleotide-binding universal stress UspA family protein
MVAFKKILFPTDFSPNADRALAHAIRLADFDGGEVIVQHVVSKTILGTHEYGVIHKHLIGTTTDKLLSKTSTPILTVKL